MTTYTFDDAELAKLNGKTLLIIGAATGIGLETVKLAHINGAKIAIGDWNEAQGQALVDELKDRVLFRKCDVAHWPDVLALFQAAHDTFGPRLDAVLCNAGINREDFLADAFDPATNELLPPDLKVLGVNLTGAVYAVKCAVHFFAKSSSSSLPRQIVLTGSAASYLDTPPLNLYCTSKAGVLGLMRALRTQLVRKNITVNMIAPWMTKSAMTRELEEPWVNEWRLPANEPAQVARALLLPVVRADVNGKAFFVAGGEIVELEEGLHGSQGAWMGEALSGKVDEGQRRLIGAAAGELTTFTANC